MAYKYYKSDLTLLIRSNIKRQTSTGEMVPVTTDTPFNVRFYVNQKGTAETGFLAWYDGTETHNCTILSPTDIMVYLDQSQVPMPTGDLYVEIEFLVPDPHFEGDDENNIKRLYTTGVTLTDNPDLHDEGAVVIDVFNSVIPLAIAATADTAVANSLEKLAAQIIATLAKDRKPICIMGEDDWDALKADTAKYNAFLDAHRDWIIDIVEGGYVPPTPPPTPTEQSTFDTSTGKLSLSGTINEEGRLVLNAVIDNEGKLTL